MDSDISLALKQANLYNYFTSLPPSHQREYLKWITDAKKDTTRQTRIKSMVQMLHTKQTN